MKYKKSLLFHRFFTGQSHRKTVPDATKVTEPVSQKNRVHFCICRCYNSPRHGDKKKLRSSDLHNIVLSVFCIKDLQKNYISCQIWSCISISCVLYFNRSAR